MLSTRRGTLSSPGLRRWGDVPRAGRTCYGGGVLTTPDAARAHRRHKRRRQIISDRMAALGWSQEELARQAGVDKSTISRVLKGERTPQTSTLERLAVALNVPLLALMGEGEGQDGTGTGGGDAVVTTREGLSSGPTSPIPLGPETGQAGGRTSGGPTAAPVHTYPGYVLGERIDPRDHATRPAALGETRRRALDVGDGSAARIGTTGEEFALLVTDSTLSHVETDGGVVAAGWTLFVNTVDRALLHTPARVVAARSRAGELVAGYLSRDPESDDGGWLVTDAHVQHPVPPDGLLGAVMLFDPPRYTTSRPRRTGTTPGTAGEVAPTFLHSTPAAP